jgi:phosphate transport system substrate-binding protein
MLAVTLAAAGACGAGAEEIRIGGSGTALGTLRMLGDAYTKLRPDVKVTVLPSMGAAGGVSAVLAGAIDIGVSTIVVPAAAREQGAVPVEIARTPFVFAVPAALKVNGITHQQLLDIYALRMTYWSDGTRIRLVLRPASISDTAFLKEISPEMNRALTALESRPGMLVVATAQEAADKIESLTGAFGTTTPNLIATEKRAIKALKVDGIEPTARAIADGSYPYFKRVFLVTSAKTSAEGRRFLAFVQSGPGRDILIQTGHVIVDAR